MKARRELQILALMGAVFAGFYFLPLDSPRFDGAVQEALALTKWYAREHVILCLLPAFWIAGAIGAFVSQQSVMRYFGPTAPKATSYGVASVSGTILAVCSCTVLPLFAGIYRMGAGLGPARLNFPSHEGPCSRVFVRRGLHGSESPASFVSMKTILKLRRMVMSLFCLSLASGGLFAADKSSPAEGKPALPRLVDLGADKCIPCKMMAPILDGLAKEYAGQLDVVFIDVWKNAKQGEPYGIRVIPTQIFYDASGQERFRHEGFFSKQEILRKWKELGVNLTAKPAGAPARKT